MVATWTRVLARSRVDAFCAKPFIPVSTGARWSLTSHSALLTAVFISTRAAVQASNPELATHVADEGRSQTATTAQGRLRQLLALAQLALASDAANRVRGCLLAVSETCKAWIWDSSTDHTF